MSNTTDNIFTLGQTSKAACRVAYILNNEQPVKCSIVSDQPLFYMDFESELEIEEDYGELFDFSDIEAGVESLQERVAALTRFNEDFSEEDDTERFGVLVDNLAFATRPFTEDENRHADIKFLENALKESRLAASFIEFAAGYGTKLCYDAQVEGALYDRQGGQIHVNPNMCREDQILLSIRELRRVWQHRNGALINPLTFHPDQAILVNRAQIADLTVMMIRVAWELQLAGDKTAWERLERSSLADLTRAFAREAYLDFRTLNNGIAQSAVFECWFLSERCRREDKKLIQNMLADYQGYVFDNEQASHNIGAELVIALGTMPFGKNYLAPYVSTIMEDAIFTEVRDRSNANFLWFIKFERSFRETEQELQTDNDVIGYEDLHNLSDNKDIRFGDHEKETHQTALSAGRDKFAASKSGANVIQFPRTQGSDPAKSNKA